MTQPSPAAPAVVPSAAQPSAPAAVPIAASAPSAHVEVNPEPPASSAPVVAEGVLKSEVAPTGTAPETKSVVTSVVPETKPSEVTEPERAPAIEVAAPTQETTPAPTREEVAPQPIAAQVKEDIIPAVVKEERVVEVAKTQATETKDKPPTPARSAEPAVAKVSETVEAAAPSVRRDPLHTDPIRRVGAPMGPAAAAACTCGRTSAWNFGTHERAFNDFTNAGFTPATERPPGPLRRCAPGSEDRHRRVGRSSRRSHAAGTA